MSFLPLGARKRRQRQRDRKTETDTEIEIKRQRLDRLRQTMYLQAGCTGGTLLEGHTRDLVRDGSTAGSVTFFTLFPATILRLSPVREFGSP